MLGPFPARCLQARDTRVPKCCGVCCPRLVQLHAGCSEAPGDFPGCCTQRPISGPEVETGTKPLGVTVIQGIHSLARAEHGQTRCTSRQCQGTWAGTGALCPDHGLPPHPNPHTRDSAGCGGLCWRAEPCTISLQQTLTPLSQVKAARRCLLHAASEG